MKVAVIGCGTIANAAHIPAYMKNAEAEIKYFCDIIPERAQKAVEDYNCGIAISDYREALADPEITAVSVCTPNNGHKDIAIEALRAGKHVLCEKPAARTYPEALEMQKAQHETGKTLNIGVVNRFNTAVNRIKNHIDAGDLGEVYHVYVSFRAHRSIPGLGGAFTTKAIAGGGALIDWGVHFLDIVMYCCGDPAVHTVSGETFSKLGNDINAYVYEDMWAGPPTPDGIFDVDDSMTALIRTAGPVVSVNGAWAENINAGGMFIDFMGTKAGIRLQYGGNYTLFGTKDGKLTEVTSELDADNMFNDMFQEEIDAFVRCVQTGEKLASHIDTVIITAQMMQAIYDSAQTHKEVAF
ncbi:MAG: Gfo/Idh/MocA family oxidoreductase [Defluviitaleaceae bacterium]|nr:Gfo/Idh/MocA family oxidoreductase [Defluviitaleaceae bacterium]MCL2274460.1 Gfo/Idh/MocA family oxidoreductase [Defluviitaleaceae bacterium]